MVPLPNDQQPGGMSEHWSRVDITEDAVIIPSMNANCIPIVYNIVSISKCPPVSQHKTDVENPPFAHHSPGGNHGFCTSMKSSPFLGVHWILIFPVPSYPMLSRGGECEWPKRAEQHFGDLWERGNPGCKKTGRWYDGLTGCCGWGCWWILAGNSDLDHPEIRIWKQLR